MTRITDSRTGDPGLTDHPAGTASGEHIQEMSAEEIEARNREIYRRKQEGAIQSQLAREYGLSPEWIRRICEDQERLTVKPVEHSNPVSEAAGSVAAAKRSRPVITVYDFCSICTDGEAEIQIWSVEPGAEKQLFSGTVQDAMRSEFAQGIIVSCNPHTTGIRLNIDTENR